MPCTMDSLGPRNHIVDGNQISTQKGALWGKHTETWPGMPANVYSRSYTREQHVAMWPLATINATCYNKQYYSGTPFKSPWGVDKLV